MTGSIPVLASAYLDDPTAANLNLLRRRIRSSENFQSDLDVEPYVRDYLDCGDYDAVIRALFDLMPGAFFSPRVHTLLGTAYAATGQTDKARRERRLARAATDSIFSTGDGSAEQPWSVVRISDEYDVLRSLGRESISQSLVYSNGRPFDKQACDDGSIVWFDLTPVGQQG